MARGRAFRRHQARLAKRRAYNHMRFWWGIEDPQPAAVGVTASTHCCRCSCYMCGNPRKWWLDLTWQEKRSLVMFREELREVGL